MRAQALNNAASVPGVLSFNAPQPQYKNFAPRIGINYSIDPKTSIRAGFGLGYDVIFDNVGLLSFPPQYSSTNSTNDGNINYTGNKNPNGGDQNFLGGYSNVAGAPVVHGLPPGNGGLATFCNTGTGGSTGVACVFSAAKQKAATAAYLPNQTVPYSESWNLQVQHSFGSNYVLSVGYVGTRGIHLLTQIQLNKQAKATKNNQLTTYFGAAAAQIPASYNISTAPTVLTLAQINALSAVIPVYATAGFTGTITSYQPFSQSAYNGLDVNLTRRMQHGLQMNLSYTWSKTMDDATAEVNSTSLTPRRAQDSQCIACDYSRSALDRTHRVTLEMVYDLPFYKTSSSFLMKNVVGNWEIAPVYTYESPEYATVLSNVGSNLNGDSAPSRTFINTSGAPGTGTTVHAVYSSTLASLCTPPATQCTANTVGYVANNPNAYYVQGGSGTAPNASRNTLPIRPIDNFDVTALKRITFKERYSVEFDVNAFNVLNHAQYIPGSIDTVNVRNTAGVTSFNAVTSSAFNVPGKTYLNHNRQLQLAAKIRF